MHDRYGQEREQGPREEAGDRSEAAAGPARHAGAPAEPLTPQVPGASGTAEVRDAAPGADRPQPPATAPRHAAPQAAQRPLPEAQPTGSREAEAPEAASTGAAAGAEGEEKPMTAAGLPLRVPAPEPAISARRRARLAARAAAETEQRAASATASAPPAGPGGESPAGTGGETSAASSSATGQNSPTGRETAPATVVPLSDARAFGGGAVGGAHTTGPEAATGPEEATRRDGPAGPLPQQDPAARSRTVSATAGAAPSASSEPGGSAYPTTGSALNSAPPASGASAVAPPASDASAVAFGTSTTATGAAGAAGASGATDAPEEPAPQRPSAAAPVPQQPAHDASVPQQPASDASAVSQQPAPPAAARPQQVSATSGAQGQVLAGPEPEQLVPAVAAAVPEPYLPPTIRPVAVPRSSAILPRGTAGLTWTPPAHLSSGSRTYAPGASYMSVPGVVEGGHTEVMPERPGSDGEHLVQRWMGTTERADRFYNEQMLDRLNEQMQEFVARQEMFFLATADRKGECDSTFRAGPPGFVQVLDAHTLAYPEYRGNGVLASVGNLSENPQLGMMFIDFTRDRIGLHVNGKARISLDEEMRERHPDLPFETAPGRRPQLWVEVEVEEAFIHCRKHIPRMVRVAPQDGSDRKWGTDDKRHKGGDFFGAAAEAAEEASVVQAAVTAGGPVEYPAEAAVPPQTPEGFRREARRALERAGLDAGTLEETLPVTTAPDAWVAAGTGPWPASDAGPWPAAGSGDDAALPGPQVEAERSWLPAVADRTAGNGWNGGQAGEEPAADDGRSRRPQEAERSFAWFD
ncbi:pyridoxamine 5'-phosphate oxidase family protein [Streptomyces sp. NPDC059740]|uniref:pyridoxamine 5'-phosphate oxidase family protein n=1 Tax=Streptomyces sp. NPDC059740 TaxID=3346926 RepID=UPI00364FB90D